LEEEKQEALTTPEIPAPRKRPDYPGHFERFWESASQIHGKPSKTYTFERYKKRLEKWEGTAELFAEHLCHAITIEKDRRRAERKAGKFVADWPHWTTWLNQYRDEQEFTGDSHVDLKEKSDALALACSHCGKTGKIHQELVRIEDRYACIEHYWEHHCGEVKALLRKGWELAQQRCPKLKDESNHEYFRRWLKAIKRDGGFLRPLPYDKRGKLAGNNQARGEEILTGAALPIPESPVREIQHPFDDGPDGFDHPALQPWPVGG
jgi:hypothetical protein